MTVETIKAMLDACYQAKRIRDLMPDLPEGVMPSFIQYLDTVDTLERRGVRIRISDISDALDLPRPGVTRTVKDMTAKGYLEKASSADDGRVTYISITEAGRQLSQRYDKEYFARLAPLLADIPDADAECAVRTIKTIHRIMSERRITLE